MDRNMWRDRFGRGLEPVVRLLNNDDSECENPVLENLRWER